MTMLCSRLIRVRLWVAMLILTGCGPALPPPPELLRAQQAFGRANAIPAVQAPVAELEAARLALKRAERAFAEHPASPVTRDLAYLALRQVEQSESSGKQLAQQRELAGLDRQQAELRARLLRQRVERVRAIAAARARSEAARIETHLAARAKIQQALEELRSIGEISEDDSAIVLRIAEHVLFSRNQKELTSGARTTLQRVARCLGELDQTRFVVLAYTDAAGSPERNRRLSLKEADQVRLILLAAGLPAQQVEVAGQDELRVGSRSPVRWHNRRVEIRIKRPTTSDAQDVYSGQLVR